MVSSLIIEAVQNKEEGSFALLYKECIPYVYTVTRRHVDNESNIPDVIQEIFARLFLSITTFNPSKGDFKPWLRRLVINQCYQHYQKIKPAMLHVPIENAAEVAYDDIDLDALSREEIEDILKEMPEGYRRVFLLVVIEEFNHQEVGEILNISKATSRSQLARAKKWLRGNIPNTLKSVAHGT